MTDPVILRAPQDFETFRIKPSDTNRMALFIDPIRDKVPFIGFVEVFDKGGATPPNTHADAYEVFYVLEGEGVATCGGKTVPIRKGDFLSVAPGTSISLPTPAMAASIASLHAAERGLRRARAQRRAGAAGSGRHRNADRRRRSARLRDDADMGGDHPPALGTAHPDLALPADLARSSEGRRNSVQAVAMSRP